MTDTIEPGDIVQDPRNKGLHYRCYQIQGGIGSFYRVTKRGWRDRRENGFSGPMKGWELVRKCEFPAYDCCQKCGKKDAVLINGGFATH